MENKKKIHGRRRGSFLNKPPVVDLKFEKKDELVKDFFTKKTAQPIASSERAPIKISKLEKVALPVLVVAAVFVGCSLVFNLFFYKANVDFKKEAKIATGHLLETIAKSVSYLGEDLKVISVAPSIDLLAGIGFLGDKIADLAELGSVKTISLIESLNKI